MDYWAIFLSAVGLLISIAAIVPELDMKTWWIRNWIYARQQIFWALLLIIALFVFSVRPGTAIEGSILTIMGIALIYAFSSVFPYIPVFSNQTRVPASRPIANLSLLIANVLQDNEQHDGLLKIIRDTEPDVVFLSEVNQRWADHMAPLKADYPHQVELPLEDYNGLCLYSRCKIVESQIHYLVQDHVPSFHLQVEIAAGQIIDLYAVHPRPPRPEDDPDDLDQELKILAHEAYASERPVIVTGDLNEVGWSRALRQFENMSGLRDAQRGRMICNSYNAKIPLLRWPLDHAYHSPEFVLEDIQRLPPFGSDHFPVLFKFALCASE